MSAESAAAGQARQSFRSDSGQTSESTPSPLSGVEQLADVAAAGARSRCQWPHHLDVGKDCNDFPEQDNHCWPCKARAALAAYDPFALGNLIDAAKAMRERPNQREACEAFDRALARFEGVADAR